MNRQDVIRDNMVDRYLLGQLSDDECDAFEVFFLTCPETLDELEATEQLIGGFKGSSMARRRDAGRMPALRTAPAAVAQRRATNWAALAASVIAVIGVSFGIFSMRELGERQALLAASDTAIEIITLGATRSSDARTLSIPEQPVRLAIELDLGLAEVERYSVRVSDAGGVTIWSAGGLAPNDYDALTFSLPPGTLEPGRYRLSAEPERQNGNRLEIELDVVHR